MLKKIQHTTTVPEDLSGQRLDKVLAKLFPDYSRSCLQNWIKKNQITIDGRNLRAKDPVNTDQEIIIDAELEEQTDWQAQEIPLDIIYEDDNLIIINKPAGMVSHPAAGNYKDTLVNALLHYDSNLQKLPRAGLIHRLDKDTSGLLLIARSLAAHTHLVSMMQERLIKRKYLALVHGIFTGGGTIDAPIDRHPKHRTKMAVVDRGKPAVTHYSIQQRFIGFTLLNIKLETGRTHQIRVHMAHINHPVVGDQTYGGRPKLPKNCSADLRDHLQNFKRQALHAWRLEFTHPITQESIKVEAPMPEDFQQLITELS